MSRSIFYNMKRWARKNGSHAATAFMLSKMSGIPLMSAAYMICGKLKHDTLSGLHVSAISNYKKFGKNVAKNFIRNSIRGRRLVA